MLRALALALVTSCYSPSLTDCTITCGSSSPCPDDLSCGSDQFCHATAASPACVATLNVTTNGAGNGRVTSMPDGVKCTTHSSDNCSSTFPLGTNVTLTAEHDYMTNFAHWSGDACNNSPNPTCMLTLDASMGVQAIFH